MGKFNWWRRSKKKKPLDPSKIVKGRSVLLQQIQHGDYDHSDYKRQAEYEMKLCTKAQREVERSWMGGPDSLREKLDEIYRYYRKRYNRLLDDYHQDEAKILSRLRSCLIKEFKVDLWDSVVEGHQLTTVEELYYLYKTASRNISNYTIYTK